MVSQHLAKGAPRGAARPPGPAPLQVRRRRQALGRPRVPGRVRLLSRVGIANRSRRLATGSPSASAHAGAALVVGRRCQARLEGVGAAAEEPEASIVLPGPDEPVSFEQHIKRSSASSIGGRCASRWTAGRTRTWPGTPTRFSIACRPGRCLATEPGPRSEARSSSAGSSPGGLRRRAGGQGRDRRVHLTKAATNEHHLQ